MAEHTLDVSLPGSIEDFVALRNQLCEQHGHVGGAAAFVVAMHLYALDPGGDGLGYLTCVIEPAQLDDGSKGYKGKQPRNPEQQRFKERIAGRPYLARSYFQGTSPQNGYALPSQLKVAIREQGLAGEVSEDTAKVFVHSTGADSPRALHLKKNNRGVWKGSNWSSLQVGCRPPEAQEDDDI
jgi:Domain of unknown function (DUF6935)